MKRHVDIAILGAGSAGLSAYKEATKYKNNVILIDNGQLGTTCAQTGCMPSKTFIQAANDFHRRHYLSQQGIQGSEGLTVDLSQVMQHVRDLRDYFASGVIRYTESLKKQLFRESAQFVTPNRLQVGEHQIDAERVIVATGSHSIVPQAWQAFNDYILTSENLFEQTDLSDPIAVIGAGVIGLELGQAMARLGITINMFHAHDYIGGLTDPEVNQVAIAIMKEQLTLNIGERAEVTTNDHNGQLTITSNSHQAEAKQILAAMGRQPNIKHLGLEQLNIELDNDGLPHFDQETLQIPDTPLYIAGDVNQHRPLLHEASDEGRIAGYNATKGRAECFQRRVPLHIVFTQPNIAVVGQTYATLCDQNIAIGQIDYSDQGRARIKQSNQGLLRVYGHPTTSQILGAELIAPEGEHLAHLLAWIIQTGATVYEALQLPFYHPVVEEGLRTALRDLANNMKSKATSLELAMCDSNAPMN